MTIKSLARRDFPEIQFVERSRVVVAAYLDGDEIFITQVVDINNDGWDGSHVRHFFAYIVQRDANYKKGWRAKTGSGGALRYRSEGAFTI
ncbi:MAG: hypothetical protein QOI53_3966 [Verrucomicrobiota bacterium]|nr:hypothetical protein [Verrucomicrobiota bacterium]